MSEVSFNYRREKKIKIQCNMNDKMEDIIKKCISQLAAKKLFIYNGKKIKEKITFNEQANEEDKKNNIMNIIYDNNNIKEELSKKPKYMIYPECKENLIINT